MKQHSCAKKTILIAILALGLALICIGRVPELPSSKPMTFGANGLEIRAYLLENLLAIVLFVVSLVIGALAELYGLSLRRSLSGMRSYGEAMVMLGGFILVSGLWMLTDSRTLTVFTTECGGILNSNAIVFVSYISFMLMPILFISFIRHIVETGEIIRKIDEMLILNLCIFVICGAFHLPRVCFILFLAIHHALIYILMITGVFYCMRNFRRTASRQDRRLARGVLALMLFSGAALIAFLLGFPHLYAAIYSIGFIIMIQYMTRLTVHRILDNYRQSMKTELYRAMAYTDELTELKNRNAFINEQCSRAVDGDSCCIVVDINQLKRVNDSLGHIYGDQLIRRSARVIHDAFSDLGACYRIGGDEFAVVCRNCDEAAVERALLRMDARIAAENAGDGPEISLSRGYAFGGGDVGSFSELFRLADERMYLDKRDRGCARDSAQNISLTDKNI